jgi:hypothetical protein
MPVPEWHERILLEALEAKKSDPDFTFNLRQRNNDGRLDPGRLWFNGDDKYLSFAPFRPNNNETKTKTIGFVIDFDRDGEPVGCSLEILFDSAADDLALCQFYRGTVEDLGNFININEFRYRYNYPIADPLQCFKEFVTVQYPRILKRIHEANLEQTFLVPDVRFKRMLDRVQVIRDIAPRGETPTANDDKTKVCEPSCKNLILYGPPGTGKTHWLRTKFAEYEDEPGHVDDATWLQETLSNYGWRPVIAAVLADLKKPARVPEIRDHPWLIAKAKQRGRTPASCHQTLWGFLQEHTPTAAPYVNSSVRRAPFIFSKLESGDWQLEKDWKEQDDEAAQLFQKLTAGSQSAKEKIRRYRVVTFHPSFGYEDFVRGIRPVIADETGTAQFRCVDGVFKIICDEARANPAKRYALFIDEINRANIAKVFGELITLIEPDKRAVFDADGQLVKGMAVQLPGGDGAEVAEPPFGVPENLDIYGTMNTADRSIALLDIALRRRFEFKELPPDYTTIDIDIDGINLGKLLERVNDRLEYFLDRDHRIGHAYLIRARTLADLQKIFATQIIPLLQEYFFDDLAKVAVVLTTDLTASPFVKSERVRRTDLFPGGIPARIAEERTRYIFTPPETWSANSFRGLYAANEAAAVQQDIDDAL